MDATEQVATEQVAREQVAREQVAREQVRMVDIPVTDEGVALNMMVSFLSLAQKRGVFTFEESAKIWDCINVFKKN